MSNEAVERAQWAARALVAEDMARVYQKSAYEAAVRLAQLEDLLMEQLHLDSNMSKEEQIEKMAEFLARLMQRPEGPSADLGDSIQVRVTKPEEPEACPPN